MEELKKLFDIFQEPVEIKKIEGKSLFSIVISSKFSFFRCKFLGSSFVVAKYSGNGVFHELNRLYRLIKDKFDENVVFAFDSVRSYDSLQFLKNRIPFISSKNFFLPFLGLLLQPQDNCKKISKERFSFSPMEQLVFLSLLFDFDGCFTQQDLVQKLASTSMNVSRAMNFFVSHNMVLPRIGGQTNRKIVYSIPSKKEFYQVGKNFLINPVQEIVYVRKLPLVPMVKSGLSALSERTMVADDSNATFAVSKQLRHELDHDEISNYEGIDIGSPKIQIMKYNPVFVAQNNMADPITTMLSINSKDERIENAINEMMEKYEWFMD